MPLLDRLRARRARARLLRIVGLGRRLSRIDPYPRPAPPQQDDLQIPRHLAMAEAAVVSVDLDLLARDLGVEVREDAFLQAHDQCDALLEPLRGGLWRLTLAEGLPSDDRRLLSALLLAFRAERPMDVGQMRLRARDAWLRTAASPHAHATALSLLAPPRSLRVLAHAFPADPARQAQRLRIGVDLLRLAQRSHATL